MGRHSYILEVKSRRKVAARAGGTENQQPLSRTTIAAGRRDGTKGALKGGAAQRGAGEANCSTGLGRVAVARLLWSSAAAESFVNGLEQAPPSKPKSEKKIERLRKKRENKTRNWRCGAIHTDTLTCEHSSACEVGDIARRGVGIPATISLSPAGQSALAGRTLWRLSTCRASPSVCTRRRAGRVSDEAWDTIAMSTRCGGAGRGVRLPECATQARPPALATQASSRQRSRARVSE